MTISYHFAILRNDILHKRNPDHVLMERAAKMESDMIQWSIDTMTKNPGWSYRSIEVRDSQHVWNGVVQAFYVSSVASAWNSYRSLRILLTRTQEVLLRRLCDSNRESMSQGVSKIVEEHQTAQLAYFRSVRRQMTDDICASVPTQLGHAAPAPNSQCIAVTAYSSIWPIFLAATCSLERIGFDVWNELLRPAKRGIPQTSSAAHAQAAWLLSRLEYISKDVGLRWADGMAAILRGDFYHVRKTPEYVSRNLC